jgi:dolichyl-phosphate beta-glucosyltransferase
VAAHLTASIVVPAYNEEARLAALFRRLRVSADLELGRAGLSFMEAVVVDDGSTDGTGAMLAEAAARDARLRIVPTTGVNLGKGAAVAAGVEEARGEMILVVDVDLSTPLSDVWKLTQALEREGATIAIGSRVLPGASVVAPARRRLLGAAFNRVVRLVTGLPFGDTQCGLKLMPTSIAGQLLERQVCRRYAWDVELLLRARRAGLSVAAAPVTYVHSELSSIRVTRDSAQMLCDVLRIRWRVGTGVDVARSEAAPHEGGEDAPARVARDARAG